MTNPALNAMMAEIIKMLPEPYELVCLLCLSFIYFTYLIFSLAQNEMLLLYGFLGSLQFASSEALVMDVVLVSMLALLGVLLSSIPLKWIRW